MSAHPARVQLSRRKGWRMPPNTIKVDRSTQFGNPFKLAEGPAASVAAFRDWIGSTPQGKALAKAARERLRGANLACWCPLDGPCHADVLLEIANEATP
jgi:uncharacterized protein DUF4326